MLFLPRICTGTGRGLIFLLMLCKFKDLWHIIATKPLLDYETLNRVLRERHNVRRTRHTESEYDSSK